MNRIKEIRRLFLESALTEENPFMDTDRVPGWIQKIKEKTHVQVTPILFRELDQWVIDSNDGNIRHRSGGFFSIEGINVRTNWGDVPQWSQPIINQPEVGILGIITKKINGILYFLMQGKIEPGNINSVQLAPTLQATRSNYTRKHEGNSPEYLEYFNGEKTVTVLLDQLQSEQGARFLKKRNRNILVLVEDDVPQGENFVWLTLGQIKTLLRRDNLVNMDTRTVISGIPFETDSERLQNTGGDAGQAFGERIRKSLAGSTGHLHEIEDIISWITGLKTRYDLEVNRIPLNGVKDWVTTGGEIHHKSGKFFSVLAVSVEIGNREVRKWTQPIIKPAQEGIVAFLVKEINGVIHFLVQAKVECGNLDILELAPTVQCLTGNYRLTREGSLPFLSDVMGASSGQIRLDVKQSEEGGRFFQEENRNMVIEVGDEFETELPENYLWMTLAQLKLFLKFNNYLNIQSRSLISAIPFI